MTRAVEGKLQRAQTKIRELERNFEVAAGKMHARYHEWLEELNLD